MMLKTRRLHRDENDKEKLYAALRALYKDGVRVYTGQLRPDELVRRRVDDKMRTDSKERPGFLALDRDDRNCNPYDSGARPRKRT